MRTHDDQVDFVFGSESIDLFGRIAFDHDVLDRDPEEPAGGTTRLISSISRWR